MKQIGGWVVTQPPVLCPSETVECVMVLASFVCFRYRARFPHWMCDEENDRLVIVKKKVPLGSQLRR